MEMQLSDMPILPILCLGDLSAVQTFQTYFLADWQPKIRGLGCIDPKGICQDFAPFALRPPKFRLATLSISIPALHL
jgi:hypothetical protein